MTTITILLLFGAALLLLGVLIGSGLDTANRWAANRHIAAQRRELHELHEAARNTQLDRNQAEIHVIDFESQTNRRAA
ncbi:MAG: hypothetical protein JO100_09855 [Pseudonocardia sp.]|nr:hypothetical protein [Pseudonocardia sp.]